MISINSASRLRILLACELIVIGIQNCSYPRNVDSVLSEILVFKLFRAEAATGAVTSPAIVITLDIIKHRRPHYFPADNAFPVDTFHFQRVKEAFHAGIVITAAFCAHAPAQIMAFL